MILRSVIKHVRNQEWTAVFLDFLIVVVGVFVGLQVSNWNDVRHNETRKAFALNALQDEFEMNIEVLQYRYENLTARNMVENKLASTISLGELRGTDKELVQDALARIMYFGPITISKSSYEALEQSGDLALIDDQATLMALNEFNAALEWAQIQRNGFRTGIAQLADYWRPYVLHSPTDDPRKTIVDYDFTGIVTDRPASSALTQVVRMKNIFSGYFPQLIEKAVVACDRIASQTGRPCDRKATKEVQ